MSLVDILVQFFMEYIFLTIFGFIGHVFVRIVTFGRVELDWGSEGCVNDVVTSLIGVVVFVLFLFGGSYVFGVAVN